MTGNAHASKLGSLTTTLLIGLGAAMAALLLASGNVQATNNPVGFTAGNHQTDNATFGGSVAVDGDTAIVGASAEHTTGPRGGAVYVFEHSNGAWTLQDRLVPPSPKAYGFFGEAVSVDGSTAVVGARGHDASGYSRSGIAYVYTLNGGSWSLQEKLSARTPQNKSWFGFSVAVEDDTIVVGAPEVSYPSVSDAGASYVFRRNSGSWSQQAKLEPGDLDKFDDFGGAVELEGDTALIGNHRDDVGGKMRGSVYAFERSGSSWSRTHRLTAQNANRGASFGFSLAFDGDTAIIGAKKEHAGGIWRGAAYAFTRSGQTWSQQQKLVASTPTKDGNFGVSVALDGDTALIGEHYANVSGAKSGAAYVFTRDSGSWVESIKMTSQRPQKGGKYGGAVGLAGDHAVVGAPLEDRAGIDRGTAYAYDADHDPQAAFSFAPTRPSDHDAVQFTDRSTDDIAIQSRAWDFGDGATSTKTNPSHTFAPGTYSVCLTVTDVGGQTTKTCNSVSVSNAPPRASFTTSPTKASPGQPVSFVDRSDDGGGTVASWSWNFGDGATSSKRNPKHTYSSTGTYRVCLAVTDAQGASDSTCHPMKIQNGPPSANYTYKPSAPNAGQPVRFEELSSDADGSVSEVEWDFGDGTTTKTPNPTHTFDAAGNYSVCLTAVDDKGASSAECRQLHVGKAPPQANFTYEPSRPLANERVEFSDASHDPDGTIVSGAWSFEGSNGSAARNPSHRFADDGFYEVCRKVTDDEGATDETCKVVQVVNAPPQLSGASLSDTKSIQAGESATFSAQPTDADGSVSEVEWDFGDGTSATGRNPTHTYDEPGTYTVSVTATDEEGKQTTETFQVQVESGVPWGALLSGIVAVAGLGAAAWLYRTGRFPEISELTPGSGSALGIDEFSAGTDQTPAGDEGSANAPDTTQDSTDLHWAQRLAGDE